MRVITLISLVFILSIFSTTGEAAKGYRPGRKGPPHPGANGHPGPKGHPGNGGRGPPENDGPHG